MLEKMMKKMRRNSKKGFTLIELIVVIAILAILAAILVPSMMGYLNNARQSTADTNARTIYSAATSAAAMVVTNGGSAATVTNQTVTALSSGTTFEQELAEMLGSNFGGQVTVNVDANGEITSTEWTDGSSTGSYTPNS